MISPKHFLLSTTVIIAALHSCKEQPSHPKLSITDLKFPPTYPIEWSYPLPKPNTEYLRINHVKAVGSGFEAGDLKSYLPWVQEGYSAFGNPREGFAPWFNRSHGRQDSSTFDENGKLLAFRRYCLMCGTRVFKYDSLGFVIYHNTGSDVIHDFYYHYSFDPISRTLYYSDTGIVLSSDMSVNKLSFDTLGYLVSLKENGMLGGSVINYKYNEHRQIASIERRDSIVPGSDRDKEPWPTTAYSLSTFNYTGLHLDSVITDYTPKRETKVNHTQKLYFDGTGLPSHSVYINFPGRCKDTETRTYRYSKF